MRIVSLEDDEPFWDLLKEAIEEEFPDVEMTWVRTESEFCQRMGEFAANPPQIFILDAMVKWADATSKMPVAPEDVIGEGYYRAGLRCRRRLLENSATAETPVILFTVLERADIERVVSHLPGGTAFIAKSGDFRELILTINELTSQSPKRSKPFRV